MEEAEPGLQEYPVEALGEQVKEHGGCPESERENGFVIEVPLPLEAYHRSQCWEGATGMFLNASLTGAGGFTGLCHGTYYDRLL